jgi:hypothetical protein
MANTSNRVRTYWDLPEPQVPLLAEMIAQKTKETDCASTEDKEILMQNLVTQRQKADHYRNAVMRR